MSQSSPWIFMLSLWTDVGHCWDSFKVSFQCWNTDLTFGKFSKLVSITQFSSVHQIPCVLWKDCWKTNVFKLFSLITLVQYNLSKAILSIFLGYSKLYCKSNYICPQESKYMRILLCNLLNKRLYIFLHSLYRNGYTVICVSNAILFHNKFHKGMWKCVWGT